MEAACALLLAATEGTRSCHVMGGLSGGHGLEASVGVLVEWVRVVVNIRVEGGVVALGQRQVGVGGGVGAGRWCPGLTAAAAALTADTLQGRLWG